VRVSEGQARNGASRDECTLYKAWRIITYTGYDCICAGAEDSLRLPNQAWNDAAGSDSPLPYRSSCVGLTRQAENSWNSVPCSTKVPVGHCLRYANPCGAGRGIPGNTFCTSSKECEVAADQANGASARDSNHVCGRLEPVWVAICPSAYLDNIQTFSAEMEDRVHCTWLRRSRTRQNDNHREPLGSYRGGRASADYSQQVRNPGSDESSEKIALPV